MTGRTEQIICAAQQNCARGASLRQGSNRHEA